MIGLDFIFSTYRLISIVVDDDQWEPDEEFFIKITLTENKENSGVAKIGKKHIMTIR